MAEQPFNSQPDFSPDSAKGAEGSLRGQHLRLAGTPDALPRIREAVVAAAERCGLNGEDIAKIEMAAGEACSNIIEHAYHTHPTRPDIEVDIREFANRIEITILDYSTINFPVDEMPGVELDEYIETQRRRGLGLYIIRNFVDRVEHRFICGQGNELRLVKYFA
ncbi:MAG TPA: ATP-binding protein [Abditibacteriaceae bacterium]|nr:ATP-binding protein [Abditibacteriaceae bacterium]